MPAMDQDGTAAMSGCNNGEEKYEGEAMDASATTPESNPAAAVSVPQQGKPKLDADEMRRRRLAKLNTVAPHDNVSDPIRKKGRILCDYYFFSSDALFTSSRPTLE